MSDSRLYKLTEVDFIQHDYSEGEFDHKEKQIPTVDHSASTPSIRSEYILSVRERADSYFNKIETKDVTTHSFIQIFLIENLRCLYQAREQTPIRPAAVKVKARVNLGLVEEIEAAKEWG